MSHDFDIPFGGMRLVVDDRLADFDLVRRSWRERLFTRTWQPWRSHNQIEKPPVFILDQAKGIIYTTNRGLLALRNSDTDRVMN